MKAINLTDDQKNKLLEMCETLSPNDTFSWEYEMYGKGLGQSFDDVLCVIHYLEKPIATKTEGVFIEHMSFNIHWFEFCMIDLVEKLLYKENEKQSQFYLTTLSYKRGVINIHPVDYLYEEFNKLK